MGLYVVRTGVWITTRCLERIKVGMACMSQAVQEMMELLLSVSFHAEGSLNRDL